MDLATLTATMTAWTPPAALEPIHTERPTTPARPKYKTTGRRLTPEQEAKRDERRAKFRGLCQRLASMNDEQRLEFAARCPVIATVEGRALSGHNQHLIALQIPGATIVGGFRQWITAGRCVRKGEHGAMIWVPVGGGKAEAGQESTETERPGFIMGTIFDVSQTDAIQQEPT